jgi:hypothetical protein
MSMELDAELPEFGSEASIDSNASSSTGVSARIPGRIALEPSPSISGLVGEIATNGNAVGSMSTGLVIGLTIAIVLPPTLLAGFVLGYLFR